MVFLTLWTIQLACSTLSWKAFLIPTLFERFAFLGLPTSVNHSVLLSRGAYYSYSSFFMWQIIGLVRPTTRRMPVHRSAFCTKSGTDVPRPWPSLADHIWRGYTAQMPYCWLAKCSITVTLCLKSFRRRDARGSMIFHGVDWVGAFTSTITFHFNGYEQT